MSLSFLGLDTGLAGVAAPPDAPPIYDYDQVIGADARIREWWMPMAGYVSPATGNIQTMLSQKAAGGTSLTQANVTSRPLLMSDSSINGRPFLRFTRVTGESPDRYLYNTFPPGSFTKGLLVRLNSGALTEAASLWGSDNVDGRHLLSLNAIGNLTQTIDANADVVATTVQIIDWRPWRFVLASWDEVLGISGLSVDGAPFVTTTKTVGQNPVVTVANSSIGSGAAEATSTGANIDIAEVFLANVPLTDAAHADVLTYLKSYVINNFGLALQ